MNPVKRLLYKQLQLQSSNPQTQTESNVTLGRKRLDRVTSRHSRRDTSVSDQAPDKDKSETTP